MTRLTGISDRLRAPMHLRRHRLVAGLTATVLVLIFEIACGAPPATVNPTAPVTTIQPEPAATRSPPANDQFANLRQEMVSRQIAARGVSDALVLEAMRAVSRHKFVPPELIDQAYEDHPVPIGYGQTISQPYIVALMTEKLHIRPGDRVLEIGTGSGYQAAVLAEITDQVYSVEIIPQLAQRAAKTLRETGYASVQTLNADGYYGWEEHAPYEAIIVTAAPDHVPRPLIQQLKDGGRLVIPIGPPGGYQTLWQITRNGNKLQTQNLGGVRFVPFTGTGIGSGEGQD